MKKVFYIVCIMFISMIINACEKNISDDNNRNIVPEKLFKSYINTFVKCESLDAGYLAGLEIDTVKKVFDMNNTTWNSMWPDTVTHDFFSVTDGIVVVIKGLAKDSSGYFYDVPQIGSDDFLFSNGHSPNEPFYLQRKEGYDKYITMIGDTLFNKITASTIAVAILDTLSYIDITTDKNFDVNHPAGANLSSIFSIYFQDPYAFIKNGYQPPRGTYNNNNFIAHPEERIYAPLFKVKLSETNFAERPFIGNDWYCLLDAVPEKTGEYVFNVKVTLIDGTVLETQSPPINIKGIND